MASSNRHWPSMFKSKPCNSTLNHQWQHDPNPSLISSPACNRPTYSSGLGCEERTPEPKPRWNPRPEQIRILEAIFNSGMVNPPRDEIRKIRVQLQEYGQVGDANVFYWFQNRKSRSKHKQRQLQATAAAAAAKPHQSPPPPPPPVVAAKFHQPMPSAPNSSSSSGVLSPNSSNEKTHSGGSATPTATGGASDALIDYLNSPTASVNQQTFTQAPSEFQLAEPFFFPVQQSSPAATSMGQEFFFSGGVADQGVGSCENFLLSELMLMSGCPSKIQNDDDHEKMKLDQHLGYGGPAAPNPSRPFLPPSVYSPDNQIIQGVAAQPAGPTKAIVFINDVCFEVGMDDPFNVREVFGDDAVLIQSSGQPVLTDEWGVTLHPLQHGAFYYLLRPFTPSPDDVRTIELI